MLNLFQHHKRKDISIQNETLNQVQSDGYLNLKTTSLAFLPLRETRMKVKQKRHTELVSVSQKKN